MKQAERISEASFLIDHMSYQSGITPAFKSAAKVFQDVLNNYEGRLTAPTLKEKNNLPSDIDDDFDCYFYTKKLNLSCFCDKLSAACAVPALLHQLFRHLDRALHPKAEARALGNDKFTHSVYPPSAKTVC